MTSRERVLTALNHEEPDRVPIQADFTPESADMISQHLKLDDTTAEAYSGKTSELPLILGHDMLVAWHGIATSYYQGEKNKEYTCEWGIKWGWFDYPGGSYTDIIEYPLEDDKALSGFTCPDPSEDWRYNSARQLLKEHKDTHAIVGGMPCTLFEAAWYLRGYDRFLVDLIINKDFVNELLDKLMGFQLVTGSRLANLDLDILWLGDDFGTQDSLIISPELWREFFKPRYAALIEAFRKIKPDVKIAYHSDGNVEPLLPEYIEIGVDILNAVQPQSVDPAKLKKRFGKNLSYWGSLDIQETFPHGSPDDVMEEIKHRIKTVAPGGGLILGPSHNFQPDVPLENILAYYEAAKRYGNYPINI